MAHLLPGRSSSTCCLTSSRASVRSFSTGSVISGCSVCCAGSREFVGCLSLNGPTRGDVRRSQLAGRQEGSVHHARSHQPLLRRRPALTPARRPFFRARIPAASPPPLANTATRRDGGESADRIGGRHSQPTSADVRRRSRNHAEKQQRPVRGGDEAPDHARRVAGCDGVAGGGWLRCTGWVALPPVVPARLWFSCCGGPAG